MVKKLRVKPIPSDYRYGRLRFSGRDDPGPLYSPSRLWTALECVLRVQSSVTLVPSDGTQIQPGLKQFAFIVIAVTV